MKEGTLSERLRAMLQTTSKGEKSGEVFQKLTGIDLGDAEQMEEMSMLIKAITLLRGDDTTGAIIDGFVLGAKLATQHLTSAAKLDELIK